MYNDQCQMETQAIYLMPTSKTEQCVHLHGLTICSPTCFRNVKAILKFQNSKLFLLSPDKVGGI